MWQPQRLCLCLQLFPVSRDLLRDQRDICWCKWRSIHHKVPGRDLGRGTPRQSPLPLHLLRVWEGVSGFPEWEGQWEAWGEALTLWVWPQGGPMSGTRDQKQEAACAMVFHAVGCTA